ncbi:hypothetical protein GDO86_006986 [Hymenochirus boettgeri]|uniref:Uncharacterized protein n=1 Tax=Hymenochirus boettgeri TaxID=247094 RepID=A0A8T2J8B7_9PIPI|nr:hypothetical protein GDO86_006986 [Hymenochirus boettgeri]
MRCAVQGIRSHAATTEHSCAKIIYVKSKCQTVISNSNRQRLPGSDLLYGTSYLLRQWTQRGTAFHID